MFSFFNKPRKRAISLAKLKAIDVEYICSAEYIELMILERENKSAEAINTKEYLSRPATFYFVVLTNRKYALVPYKEFWISFIDLKLKFGQKPSEKAAECLEHYITSINKS